jgi:hypothetical protein
MTTLPLDWATQNPWLAFFLAWPTALVLISWAWLFAAITENTMNLILRLANQAANAFVILARGYPPAPEEIKDDEPAA